MHGEIPTGSTRAEWKPDSFDATLPYLSPPRQTILESLWEAGELHEELETELRTAVDDSHPDAEFDHHLTVLKAWGYLEESRTHSSRNTGRIQQYRLTDPAVRFLGDHDGDLSDVAKLRADYSLADWADMPLSPELKFLEVADELIQLREAVNRLDPDRADSEE